MQTWHWLSLVATIWQRMSCWWVKEKLVHLTCIWPSPQCLMRLKPMNITFLLIFHANHLSYLARFCLHSPQHTLWRHNTRLSLNVMTKQDVLALVGKAEKLCAQAYKAHKTANALSKRAASLGKDVARSAASSTHGLKKIMSINNINEASNAHNLFLGLGSLLDEVVEAQRRWMWLREGGGDAKSRWDGVGAAFDWFSWECSGKVAMVWSGVVKWSDSYRYGDLGGTDNLARENNRILDDLGWVQNRRLQPNWWVPMNNRENVPM